MEKNYQELQVEYFPNNPTNCNGNPAIYEDLIWTEQQVSKQQLDDVWLGFLKKERYIQIDNKTSDLIEYWEKKIGISWDDNFELWEGWDEDKEILNINQIKEKII